MRMESHVLLSHLAQAQTHIRESEGVIRRQRRIIAELERDGHNSALSRELLKRFEEIRKLHVADCERLRRELLSGGLTEPTLGARSRQRNRRS